MTSQSKFSAIPVRQAHSTTPPPANQEAGVPRFNKSPPLQALQNRAAKSGLACDAAGRFAVIDLSLCDVPQPQLRNWQRPRIERRPRRFYRHKGTRLHNLLESHSMSLTCQTRQQSQAAAHLAPHARDNTVRLGKTSTLGAKPRRKQCTPNYPT